MYPLVIFLHIAGVFAFLLAHGASANVAMQLRQLAKTPVTVQTQEQLCALLDLSRSGTGMLYISLLLILATGITAGFMGSWWGHGWIWTALGVLILTIVLMGARAKPYFEDLRAALGMPTVRPQTPPSPPSPERIGALLRSSRPLEVMMVGNLGLLIILGLMVFKPF